MLMWLSEHIGGILFHFFCQVYSTIILTLFRQAGIHYSFRAQFGLHMPSADGSNVSAQQQRDAEEMLLIKDTVRVTSTSYLPIVLAAQQ